MFIFSVSSPPSSCGGNFWTGSAWWNCHFLLLTMPQNIFLQRADGILKTSLLVNLQNVRTPLKALNLQEVKSKHQCATAMSHWITQPWGHAVYIPHEVMSYSYHLNTQLWCQPCLIMTTKVLYLYDLYMNHTPLNNWLLLLWVVCLFVCSYLCFFRLVLKGTVHIFLLHAITCSLFIHLDCFDVRCLVLEILVVEISAFSQI